jgi:hypothetical protein
MADDVITEILNEGAIALSAGLENGLKEWAEEPIKEWITSLALQAFALTCGSSLVGSAIVSLGKLFGRKVALDGSEGLKRGINDLRAWCAAGSF